MIRKVVFIGFIFLISLNAKNLKYLEEKEYSNNDFRIFVGLEASYSYVRASKNIDRIMYSYSVYTGLPIFFGNELIVKAKKNILDNFNIEEKALILNIPLSSRVTNQTYVGLVAGQAKIKWNDRYINEYNITEEEVTDNFFGIHIGKKYKYTRNYYVRIELEYMKYMHTTPSSTEGIDGIHSLAFNYGFEYRF